MNSKHTNIIEDFAYFGLAATIKFYESFYQIMIQKSELQQQIARHREKHSVIGSFNPRKQPSIFLSSSEAAAIDIGTVYDAGLQGLQTLSHYDGRFEEYFTTLFHATSVDVQRDLKTPEVHNPVKNYSISVVM